MKALSIIRVIFTLVGMGMLLGSFLIYKSTSAFVGEAIRETGTVIELRESRSSDSLTYAPVVRFATRQGEAIEFRSSTSSNPPGYSVGEQVAVLYLPNEPRDARIDGFFSLWGLPLILGAMGSIFFLVGAAITLVPLLRGRRQAHLKREGMPIETEFQRVELNQAFSVNGRHPFRILTQWQNPATAELHLFHSNNLWFDPSNYLTGKRITVFIERNNPKNYVVDLSFLPQMAE